MVVILALPAGCSFDIDTGPGFVGDDDVPPGPVPPPPVGDPPPLPLMITVESDATAWVSEGDPTGNNSNDLLMSVDVAPTRLAYLRFQVNGLAGPAHHARLRFYAEGGTSASGFVTTATGPWEEATLTWNDRPLPGTPIAPIAGVPDASLVEVDVTPVIVGDGTYTLVLGVESADGLAVASRLVADPARRPTLVVDTF